MPATRNQEPSSWITAAKAASKASAKSRNYLRSRRRTRSSVVSIGMIPLPEQKKSETLPHLAASFPDS